MLRTFPALAAEFIGAAALSVAVVGSGIAAQRLTDDPALALLINAVVTAGALFVIIVTFAPISGAHVNPIVTVADVALSRAPWRTAALYLPAQLAGFIGGVVVAHAMFAEPLLSVSGHQRLTAATAIAEVVATAGLVVVIFAAADRPHALTAALVAVYIGAAYYFTSSTSFANPSLTIARMLTDSFAGIAPLSGLGFIAAQIVGGAVGWLAVRYVLRASGPPKNTGSRPVRPTQSARAGRTRHPASRTPSG